MKKITQAQCDQIVNWLFEINAPVKVYGAVKEMFEKLPVIKEKDESTPR